jgi:hypothetical protein
LRLKLDSGDQYFNDQVDLIVNNAVLNYTQKLEAIKELHLKIKTKEEEE